MYIEFPTLAAHGALFVQRLQVQPLDNAMHVKAMGADTPHQWAIVTGQRTLGAGALKGHATNATILIIRYPTPRCNSRP